MKLLLTNPEIDGQINLIKKKIRLSMNGMTADTMKQSGIVYKQNYGVNIPRIREIAGDYTPNHDLAQRLWMLKIRETMIMATLLEEVDKFTYDQAKNWLADINQIELVEQTVMNIFSKTNFGEQLVLEHLDADNLWQQLTAFILAARLYNKMSDTAIETVIDKAIAYSSTNELHLYRAIGLCLSRLCRSGENMQKKITNRMTKEFSDKNTGQKHIMEEVRQEILFLND